LCAITISQLIRWIIQNTTKLYQDIRSQKKDNMAETCCLSFDSLYLNKVLLCFDLSTLSIEILSLLFSRRKVCTFYHPPPKVPMGSISKVCLVFGTVKMNSLDSFIRGG